MCHIITKLTLLTRMSGEKGEHIFFFFFSAMQDLRIKPVPLEVEAQSSNFWTARKFLRTQLIPTIQPGKTLHLVVLPPKTRFERDGSQMTKINPQSHQGSLLLE